MVMETNRTTTRWQTRAWHALTYILAPLAKCSTQVRRPRIHTCLIYHGVVCDNESNDIYDRSVHVSSKTLEMHLSILRRLGATPCTIDDVARAISTQEPFPEFSASITFDDAYANIVENAVSVLNRYGFKATLFVPTSYVDTDELLWNDWVHYLVREAIDVAELAIPDWSHKGFMTAQEVVHALKDVSDRARVDTIKRLEDSSGLSRRPDPAGSRICSSEELRFLRSSGWSIGSHSMTHPILTRLSPSEAKKEIHGSREFLASLLGEPPAGFAYPNGDHSPELQTMVRDAGYSYAVTASGDVLTSVSEPFALPRLYPDRFAHRFTSQAVGWEQGLRRLFRW